MPKLKPDTQRARREHILDAAEFCFARAGFHRTTMQDICKEAAVSPGALYVYFDYKEALIAGIASVIAPSSPASLAALAAAPDLLAALAKLGEQYSVEQPQHKRLMCVEIGLELTRNEASARSSDRIDSFVNESFIKLFAASRSDEGRIAPALDISTPSPRSSSVIGDGMFWRRAVDPTFDAKTVMPVLHRICPDLLNPVLRRRTRRRVQSQRDRAMRAKSIIVTGRGSLAAAGAGAFVLSGHLRNRRQRRRLAGRCPRRKGRAPLAGLPSRAAQRSDFTETVLVTGSLVPREEILVGPEVEGLRVTEVLADEGERVKKGDVLATLVADTLDAQIAQNDAALARADGCHGPGQERDRAGRGRADEAQRRSSAPSRCSRPAIWPKRAYDQREQRCAHRRGAARGRPGRPQGRRSRQGPDRGAAPRARCGGAAAPR